jgi:hypothetical protein
LQRPREWFDGRSANPPLWLRLLFVPTFGLAAVLVGERRGWAVGVLAAVVYGGIGLLAALAPGGLVRWSKAHPKLDNAFLGPLLFFALAYVTHISIWWCRDGPSARVGSVGARADRRLSSRVVLVGYAAERSRTGRRRSWVLRMAGGL